MAASAGEWELLGKRMKKFFRYHHCCAVGFITRGLFNASKWYNFFRYALAAIEIWNARIRRTIMPTALQEMLFDCYLIFTCTHIKYCCAYLSSKWGVFLSRGKGGLHSRIKRDLLSLIIIQHGMERCRLRENCGNWCTTFCFRYCGHKSLNYAAINW